MNCHLPVMFNSYELEQKPGKNYWSSIKHLWKIIRPLNTSQIDLYTGQTDPYLL